MDVGDFRVAHKVVIYDRQLCTPVRMKYYDDAADANAAKAYLEVRLRAEGLGLRHGVYWEEVIIEKQFNKGKLETLIAWLES